MKKMLLLSTLLLWLCTVKAAVHVVQVSDFQFNPSFLSNVVVGDVVRWVWVSGFHTTTDNPASQEGNSLPAGAAPWNSFLSADNPSFDYTVTVAGTYNYWCVPHAPYMAGTFEATSPLPVKLSAFNVLYRNGDALIKWSTLTEQNTNYFSIKRSVNGTNFSEIARVTAIGSSAATTNYEYVEKNPGKQAYYYYHLMAVDKDGSRSFSETKMLKMPQPAQKLILSLSPNPVPRAGHLMLTFNAMQEGKMDVQVNNSQGQTVIKTQLQAYKGVNNGHVHLGDLAPGTYLINFSMSNVKEAHKIILK